MYEIMVLTHGKLAHGLKETFAMFFETKDPLLFLNFDLQSSLDEFKADVMNCLEQLPKEKSVLILTDMFGGTPCNIAMELKIQDPQRIEILSGVNLPMVLSAYMKKEEPLSQAIVEVIQEYHKAIVRVEGNAAIYGEENE